MTLLKDRYLSPKRDFMEDLDMTSLTSHYSLIPCARKMRILIPSATEKTVVRCRLKMNLPTGRFAKCARASTVNSAKQTKVRSRTAFCGAERNGTSQSQTVMAFYSRLPSRKVVAGPSRRISSIQARLACRLSGKLPSQKCVRHAIQDRLNSIAATWLPVWRRLAHGLVGAPMNRGATVCPSDMHLRSALQATNGSIGDLVVRENLCFVLVDKVKNEWVVFKEKNRIDCINGREAITDPIIFEDMIKGFVIHV